MPSKGLTPAEAREVYRVGRRYEECLACWLGLLDRTPMHPDSARRQTAGRRGASRVLRSSQLQALRRAKQAKIEAERDWRDVKRRFGQARAYQILRGETYADITGELFRVS